MGKSVLELAVGTGKWDAGLKKAKQALDNFAQANGGFQAALQKDNDKMQSFVQMMGKMDSTAKTAKGQMNDYKSTIESLTMQYNRMNDAQKKTIGKDYLQAIDQMKQKCQAVNNELKDINKSLTSSTGSGGGGGLFSTDKLSGMLQVFGGNLMTKGFDLAVGTVTNFANEIGTCINQGIELARQGEGIRIAFERLGRGDILQGLREATHGTVTDLELMKAAVKFNDFKLPVEELGTMLAFAQQKAKETGQSVDYMVDSIVTGLGRKSLMILDNLGLSANEVKEKMKETGDMTKAVGAIIREQMSKAGDYVETAADRAAQANVSLQNKMEELGRKFGPVQEASSQLWTSMKIGILDIIGGPLATLINQLTEAGRLKNALNDINGTGSNTKLDRMLNNLRNAREGNRQSVYEQQKAEIWKYINNRENYLKDRGRWVNTRDEGLRQSLVSQEKSFGTSNVNDIKAQIGAAKQLLAEYNAGVKDILDPSPSPSPGGGGKTTTKGHKSTTKVYTPGSIAYQEQLVQNLTKLWKEAGDGVRDQYVVQLVAAEQQLKKMNQEQELLKEQSQGKLLGGNIEMPGQANIAGSATELPPLFKGLDKADMPKMLSPLQQMNVELEHLKSLLETSPNSEAYQDTLDKIIKKQKDIDDFTGAGDKTAKSWTEAARAVGMVGNALSSLQDPSAQIASTVAMAIANIAMAYSETLAKDKTNKSNIWYFIATAAAAMVSMATTISSIHSATGYAQGGIVDGNQYSGDNVPIMANSGELILNRAQQDAVASAMEGNGMGNLNLRGVLSGENIVIAADRYLKRSGHGELAVWK